MGIVVFRANMPNKETGILRNKMEIIPQTNSIITCFSICQVTWRILLEERWEYQINKNKNKFVCLICHCIPFSLFPILPLVSLFKHTHLSLRQALTEEFAFLLRGELQDTQITQRCIYGICIIHEVKITCYLDERQLDN